MIRRLHAHSAFYTFTCSLLFFFFLWYINPNNKIVALSFLFFFLLLQQKLRNLRLSILLSYLASLFIFTGKTYMIEVVPPGVFPIKILPIGYVIFIIVSIKHVVAAVMLLILFLDFLRTRFSYIRPLAADGFLIIFYAWIVISDLFVSRRPDISLTLSFLSLHVPIAYLYIRAYIGTWKNFSAVIFALIIATVLFQSLVSFQQLHISSPVGKTVEFMPDIAEFGQAADELSNRFRPLGTFPHANNMAAAASFLLPILISALYIKTSYVLLISILFTIFLIVTSLSRGGWVASGITIPIQIAILTKHLRAMQPRIPRNIAIICGLLFVYLFVFFILPRIEKSLYVFEAGGGAYLREEQIKSAIAIVARYPLLGSGTLMSVLEGASLEPMGIFKFYPVFVHNAYLLIAAEHGIPALLFFLCFVISLALPILRGITNRKKRATNIVTMGAIFGIASLLIIGLFQAFLSEELIIPAFSIIAYRYTSYYYEKPKA